MKTCPNCNRECHQGTISVRFDYSKSGKLAGLWKADLYSPKTTRVINFECVCGHTWSRRIKLAPVNLTGAVLTNWLFLEE